MLAEEGPEQAAMWLPSAFIRVKTSAHWAMEEHW